MNPTSPSQVKAWCIEHGFHPSRALGQNFLIDRNVRDAIVAAAAVAPERSLLEVGPGLGALTEALLERGAIVTAIEKDTRLCAALANTFGAHGNLKLLAADMLECDLDAILGAGFDTFVSNLPYSVGTRILLDVALHRLAPRLLVVMVQSEVAHRFSAPPGTSLRGLTSVWLQRLYDVELLRTVSSACFWPRPEIASTVVRLTRHNRFPLDDAATIHFHTYTKLAFSQRRKQLGALLRRAAGGGDAPASMARRLVEAGVAATARAEELTLAQWCALAQG